MASLDTRRLTENGLFRHGNRAHSGASTESNPLQSAEKQLEDLIRFRTNTLQWQLAAESEAKIMTENLACLVISNAFHVVKIASLEGDILSQQAVNGHLTAAFCSLTQDVAGLREMVVLLTAAAVNQSNCAGQFTNPTSKDLNPDTTYGHSSAEQEQDYSLEHCQDYSQGYGQGYSQGYSHDYSQDYSQDYGQAYSPLAAESYLPSCTVTSEEQNCTLEEAVGHCMMNVSRKATPGPDDGGVQGGSKSNIIPWVRPAWLENSTLEIGFASGGGNDDTHSSSSISSMQAEGEEGDILSTISQQIDRADGVVEMNAATERREVWITSTAMSNSSATATLLTGESLTYTAWVVAAGDDADMTGELEEAIFSRCDATGTSAAAQGVDLVKHFRGLHWSYDSSDDEADVAVGQKLVSISEDEVGHTEGQVFICCDAELEAAIALRDSFDTVNVQASTYDHVRYIEGWVVMDGVSADREESSSGGCAASAEDEVGSSRGGASGGMFDTVVKCVVSCVEEVESVVDVEGDWEMVVAETETEVYSHSVDAAAAGVGNQGDGHPSCVEAGGGVTACVEVDHPKPAKKMVQGFKKSFRSIGKWVAKVVKGVLPG